MSSMRLHGKTGTRVQVAMRAWASIDNPDLSVDEAVERLRELGNTIYRVDYENRRVQIGQHQPEGTLFGCAHCGAYSRSLDTIEAHQKEHT